MEKNLGVRVVGLKDAAPRLQVGAKFGMIVNLPIENDDMTAISSGHRLGTAGEVNDGQSAMSQMEAVLCCDEEPLRIGAAVGQTPGHPFEIRAATLTEEPRYATHVEAGRWKAEGGSGEEWDRR